MTHFAAVVLAGGSGQRLGGVDKGALEISVVTVVVGDPRPTIRTVEWTREEPPGTGPLAGLLAGVELLDPEVTPFTTVFATDLTALTAEDVHRLVDVLVATPDAEAALFVDATGHLQPLAAVYRTIALVTALRDLQPLTDQPMRALLQMLTIQEVPDQGASVDCDTPEDFAALKDRAQNQV
jgi:molybdopterin-guanine dinucleotide biosynthesis protein A